jgi:hypothetical protein
MGVFPSSPRGRPSLIDSGCGTDRSAVMGEVTLCLLGRAREKKVPLYILQVVSRENKRDVGPQVGHSHAGCNQPVTLGMKRVGWASITVCYRPCRGKGAGTRRRGSEA